ncbi:hypothetical protein C8J57DRAFT_1650142 [Mycena rebaudengoi]|nr:hypothetical protein C8J57DRAFT_1650142 [Mycena rebaudengoi]
MTKSSVTRPKRNTPDGVYTPTVNAASVREKRRLQMAEKGGEKLKRRQWDPPKKQAAPLSLDSVSHDDAEQPVRPTIFHDYRAQSSRSGCSEDVGVLSPASEGGAALGSSTCGAGEATSSRSPTSKEHLASRALLTLAHVEVEGENESSGDSIFEKAVDLSSLGSTGVHVTTAGIQEVYPDTEIREREYNAEFGIHLEPGRLPPGTAPLSLRQEMELERTGFVGELSRVQAAQIRIFSLNSRDLQLPTEDEMERGVSQRVPLCTRMDTRNPYLSSRTQTFIGRWSVKVFTAVHHRGQLPEVI